VIAELNKQLAIIQPLSRQNQSAVLHLITREAADEEKRTLQRDVEELKGKEKEREREISELKTREQELKTDLKAEQQRSTQLASQARSSHHPHTGSSSRTAAHNAKYGQTIKFYEQLTNLLVTSVKIQPKSGFGSEGESTAFTCVYTCDVQPSDSVENPPALNFTLEFMKDEDGYDQVHYQPLFLENESEEFIQRLSYYSDSFQFATGQLAVFIRQMRDKILGIPEEDTQGDAGEGDESIEIEMEEG
jgi:hypothetical protein